MKYHKYLFPISLLLLIILSASCKQNGKWKLFVIASGGGSGTVISIPAGIDCGTTCDHSFDGGTQVTLMAKADSGSIFSGWAGDCSGAGICQLTMDAAKNVIAKFTKEQMVLTVKITGSGKGKITSSPAGIDCGSKCSSGFAEGVKVALTAIPDNDTNSTFTGWSGDCQGKADCIVTMNASKSVVAEFRAHVSGGLDQSFGLNGNGMVLTDVNNSSDELKALVIDDKGRIVVAGFVGTETQGNREFAFFIARYLENGQLDSSFGKNGIVTIDFGTGNDDTANALAVDGKGRIIVAGFSKISIVDKNEFVFAIARLLENGELDKSFDKDGKLTTDFGIGKDDAIMALVLDKKGRIIVAGNSEVLNNGNSEYVYSIARYLEDGSLDSSFDGDGKLTTDFGIGDEDNPYAVAIDDKDRIVVAGESTVVSPNVYDYVFSIARYLENGQLDNSFDNDGKLTTSFGGTGVASARAVSIDKRGRVVAAGYSTFDVNGSQDNAFALARYLENGQLDTSFDRDGMLVTDFGVGDDDSARAIVIDDKNRIVAAGFSRLGDISDAKSQKAFALARYLENGQLDTGFDSDGKLTTDFGVGEGDRARAIAIDRRGRIVVGGNSLNGKLWESWDIALARYWP